MWSAAQYLTLGILCWILSTGVKASPKLLSPFNIFNSNNLTAANVKSFYSNLLETIQTVKMLQKYVHNIENNIQIWTYDHEGNIIQILTYHEGNMELYRS